VTDRLEDIKAHWDGGLPSGRQAEEDVAWLIAEVERLRAPNRHEMCPDNPCPGYWPYCEEIVSYMDGIERHERRAARWRELARRRREQVRAARESRNHWLSVFVDAQNLACAAAFDCGMREAERGKAVDATRDAWRNEYEHQRSLVEINRTERRRAETQRDAALAGVAELEGLLREVNQHVFCPFSDDLWARIATALAERREEVHPPP
jgi:hypothetical protein